jgi:hypothetical protein
MNKAREYSSPLIEELINETTPEELERINNEMEAMSKKMKIEFYKNQMDDLWWIRLGIGYQKEDYFKHRHAIVLSLGFHTLFIRWR